MPTSKKSSKGASKKSGASKTRGKIGTLAASTQSGDWPPYGAAIREATARGDVQEMRKVAASARKWLNDVQAALDKMNQAAAKKSAK